MGKLLLFLQVFLLSEFILQARAFQSWDETSIQYETYATGCPVAAAIAPCVCTSDANNFMLDLDCSDVTGDEDLRKAFYADFPFNGFRNFTILRSPSQTPVPLNTLSTGTFGRIHFEHIIISHTTLEIIEGDPFVNSTNSLQTLAITDNMVTVFPFSELKNYVNLKDLRLFDNKLGRMPDIISDSLEYLHVSYNPGLQYGDEVFYQVPNLRYLGMNGLDITNVAKNTFRYLTKLETLDLGGNILNTLREGSLWFESKYLTIISLDNNDMRIIEPNTIGYCDPNPDPDTCTSTTAQPPAFWLTNNQLSDIEELVWLDSFALANGKSNYFAFDNNPLNCSCNMKWVAIDEGNKQLVSAGSKCNNGGYIVDLPADFFGDQCP